jgi:hypothetical protein
MVVSSTVGVVILMIICYNNNKIATDLCRLQNKMLESGLRTSIPTSLNYDHLSHLRKQQLQNNHKLKQQHPCHNIDPTQNYVVNSQTNGPDVPFALQLAYSNTSSFITLSATTSHIANCSTVYPETTYSYIIYHIFTVQVYKYSIWYFDIVRHISHQCLYIPTSYN